MTAGAAKVGSETSDIAKISDESPRNHLTGWPGALTAVLAVAMSCLFMYWAWASITTQIARIVFLLFTLVLSFLLYPALTSQHRSKVHWTSWVLVALSVIALGYPIVDFEEFIYRSATPNVLDQVLGALTILLVLEASRRSTGWILPVVAISALAYPWLGPYLPAPWTHRGYGLPQIVGICT